MTSADLGTKRVCPKCDAKFYDFGAVDPISCPKCGKQWRDGAKKKAATVKPKKEPKPLPKPVKKANDEDLIDDGVELPDVEDGDENLDLEPMEDETVEMTSLEEVEEHEEEEESDPNSDDAEDDMFTELAGDNKIVDDFEEHMEDEEDDEDDEDSDSDDEDDEDEDDDDEDTPKKKKKKRR